MEISGSGLGLVELHTKLVGGLEYFLFSISYMGCHPKPIDFHSIIFQDGEIAPPSRLLLTIINHIKTININNILIVYYQPMVGYCTTKH